MSCLFCGIAEGTIPSKTVYQDDQIVAFHDITPRAPIHVLVIPRAHIPSAAALTAEDGALIAHIWAKIPEIAALLGIPDSFRVVTNCGEDAGQTVLHLHYHILGGAKLRGFGA